MRALVVEDDRGVRDAVRRTLLLAGFDVRVAITGADALVQAREAQPDVVVLDIGLPDLDGLAVCRTLRAAGDRVPILMLTARVAVADRIAGLEVGADDYLPKPFDVGELLARVRALLRRSTGVCGPESLAFAELRLDVARHGAAVGDAFVELTRTEYQLLELMLLNPRRVLPYATIYERVWGHDVAPEANGLRVYVGYLRRKLEAAGARPLIHTVRAVGYVLREP